MSTGMTSWNATRSRATRKRRRIGPKDAGRLMTHEEYEKSIEDPGYVYEIIDGVLNVSPSPKPDHETWSEYVAEELWAYSRAHPDRINFVARNAEVVIPGRPGPTRPRPDLAAYKDYPREQVLKRLVTWDDLCPILVVEIISPRRPKKDTNRNRQLYWMAGGIAEYWILDPRKDAFRPTLTALRRESGQPDWLEVEVAPGERYTTDLLPGLEFHLEP